MKCPSCGETMTVTSKHAEHDDSVMLTMWCVHQSFSQEEVRDILARRKELQEAVKQ